MSVLLRIQFSFNSLRVGLLPLPHPEIPTRREDQSVAASGRMRPGIAQAKSTTSVSLKLSVDQGSAVAQYNYGLLLLQKGDGIAQHRSLATHEFKLLADQSIAVAERRYDLILENGDGIMPNESLGVKADAPLTARRPRPPNCPRSRCAVRSPEVPSESSMATSTRRAGGSWR
jgi:hypothetical protein